MSYEKFFEELQTLKDCREVQYKQIRSHKLPIVIYGAGDMVRHVTNELSAFDIPILAYAVDDEYYVEGENYLGLPVHRFSELSRHPDKYVFILGMNYDRNGVGLNCNFFKNDKLIRYTILAIQYDPVSLEDILNRKNELSKVFEMLHDDLSRETLMAYLKTRISWDLSYLQPVFREVLYFNKLTAKYFQKGGMYVDCGAYDGDTIQKFINWSREKYSRIFAIEPDRTNFIKLKNFIKQKNYMNVTLFCCGLWNEKIQLKFKGDNRADSIVKDVGENVIEADTLDNIIGNEDVGFIKLSISGSEFKALQGSVSLLKEKKPVLAVCIYYGIEHLINVANFIKNSNSNYQLYIRKHSRIAPHEFILYAL